MSKRSDNNGATKVKIKPRDNDCDQDKKVLEERQRELEGLFKDYDTLVKAYAQKQSIYQRQKQQLEDLAIEVKKERLKCKTLECDHIIVHNENEILQKKFEIIENKVNTVKDKYGSLVENTQKESSKPKPSKDEIKSVIAGITETEKIAKELLQEINDKTCETFMRTRHLSVKSQIKKQSRDMHTSPLSPASMPALLHPQDDYCDENNSVSEPSLKDSTVDQE